MNFLPLVITFLLIFSAISVSFMNNYNGNKTEYLSYKGRLRALRSAYNENEEILYDQHRVLSNRPNQSKTSKSEREKREIEKKTYFRITRMGSPHGSINLSEIIIHPEHQVNDFLYEKTIFYLKQVYESASFIKELKDPNWAKELLDSLIHIQKTFFKTNNAFLSLEKCTIEGPLKKHYPKLIRGTNSFDPVAQKGYLPLEACIHFQNNSNKAINFHFASPGLLTILFGKEEFEKIKEKERSKEAMGTLHYTKYALKDEGALQKVIGKKGDLIKIMPLLDFHFPSGYKLPKRATDPSTFISAQLWEDPDRGV